MWPRLGFHAERFEAEVLDVAGDADGDDGVARGERFVSCRSLTTCASTPFAVAFSDFRFGRGEDLQPLLLEALLGEGGDLFVFDRQHAIEQFDHRRLHAERGVEARELDADGA